MYTDHSVCSRDPECSWCQGACQAAPPPGTSSGAVSDCPGCLSPDTDTCPQPLPKLSGQGLSPSSEISFDPRDPRSYLPAADPCTPQPDPFELMSLSLDPPTPVLGLPGSFLAFSFPFFSLLACATPGPYISPSQNPLSSVRQPCHFSLQCPAASCLGLGRLLGDCQACLAFSSPTAPPRGPGTLGWCVHNESCLPRPGE